MLLFDVTNIIPNKMTMFTPLWSLRLLLVGDTDPLDPAIDAVTLRWKIVPK